MYDFRYFFEQSTVYPLSDERKIESIRGGVLPRSIFEESAPFYGDGGTSGQNFWIKNVLSPVALDGEARLEFGKERNG